MMSAVSEFKLLDRAFQEAIVLIPGWATDYRIFSELELNYNYILPIKLNPFDFSAELSRFLNKKHINEISLFGWSLGGFLAAEFALSNPDRIDEVILLSIRKRYNQAPLEEIKEKITKNKKGYLFKFYHECFSDSDSEAMSWFKKNLIKDYLNTIKIEDLISGLNYFSKVSLNTESLVSIKKLRIFHGLEDKIAPYKEAEKIKNCLPKVGFIGMPGVGHIPFLSKNFKEKFENG